MSSNLDYRTCQKCVKRNAVGGRQAPCQELHRRKAASGKLTVLGAYSSDVADGNGRCPWIATWPEVLATLKAMEQGKEVYANDVGNTILRRIQRTFDNYEEKNSPKKWERLSSEYWRKQAQYLESNGRYEHAGDCLLHFPPANPSEWQAFQEDFARNVSLPDLYTWIGVGSKHGGLVPSYPEGRDYVFGRIWNMETGVCKSIVLSTDKYGFVPQVNLLTPVLIMIGGTKNPKELVGKNFKGGFDIAFGTGIGWTNMLKLLCRKGLGVDAAKTIFAGFKKLGKDYVPNLRDTNIGGLKAYLAKAGFSRDAASLVVMDAPVGSCVELTITLNTKTQVDKIENVK